MARAEPLCTLLTSTVSALSVWAKSTRNLHSLMRAALTSAQVPRASLLFTHADQRPSCEASSLISFICSEDDLHDDSMTACLKTSTSSGLTTIDGAEEKGYEKLPPLDHCCRMESQGSPPVQILQDHLSPGWPHLFVR